MSDKTIITKDLIDKYRKKNLSKPKEGKLKFINESMKRTASLFSREVNMMIEKLKENPYANYCTDAMVMEIDINEVVDVLLGKMTQIELFDKRIEDECKRDMERLSEKTKR